VVSLIGFPQAQIQNNRSSLDGKIWMRFCGRGINRLFIDKIAIIDDEYCDQTKTGTAYLTNCQLSHEIKIRVKFL